MRYGILGSGQLAWMLSLAAQKLGHEVVMLSESDPRLEGFDFISFESEFTDFNVWGEALKNAPVYPSVEVMKQLSDKWEQKSLFVKFQIPTAKASLYEGSQCPTEREMVAKWARLGYDGYGNLVMSKKSQDLEQRWKTFSKKAKEQNSRIYLEEKIPFEAEAALVVARDINGCFLRYPLLLTEQSESVCNWVWGPASASSPEMQLKMDELWPKLESFLNSLNYVGVMAFEFFWVDGNLLLNEVAPRVHNSGHITLDAFNYSQFDLHLLAPLGFVDIQLKAMSSRYAMKNLLGKELQALQANTFIKSISQELSLYWYGKKEIRKGRKMGHFNCLFNEKSRESIREELQKEEEILWQKLKK